MMSSLDQDHWVSVIVLGVNREEMTGEMNIPHEAEQPTLRYVTILQKPWIAQERHNIKLLF